MGTRRKLLVLPHSQKSCSPCVYHSVLRSLRKDIAIHILFSFPRNAFCSHAILLCSLKIIFCSLKIKIRSYAIIFRSLNLIFCSLNIIFRSYTLFLLSQNIIAFPQEYFFPVHCSFRSFKIIFRRFHAFLIAFAQHIISYPQYFENDIPVLHITCSFPQFNISLAQKYFSIFFFFFLLLSQNTIAFPQNILFPRITFSFPQYYISFP